MKHYLQQELYEMVKSDERIFEFIQNGSLDGIWYWDLENPENEWMSEKFWTEFGYDPKEREHKPSEWMEIINKDDLKLAEENFKKHCSDPRHPYDQTVRYRHKNGSTVHIRCRGLVIRNDKDIPVRMLGAHTNITEIVESKLQFQEINEKLNEKNLELKQFSYLTSHDLQEPLNTIISFANLLEDRKDEMDEMGRKSLDIIVNSACRMKEFIAAILLYSQIGKRNEKKEVIVSELIENVKADLQELIKNAKAKINYIGNPIVLQAYEVEFTKLFQNLIVNGIKYVKKDTKPKIVINAKEYSKYYKFSVQDNGIGIAEEYHEKIFEIFQRLHTRDKFSGTGIGLSHCKKVVELHDGKIWLSSKEGKGSTFYFTIKK